MISRPPTGSVSRVGRDRKTWKEHACTNRYTRSLDSVSNTLMTFLAIARPAINTTQAASTPHTLPQTTKHCYGNIAFLQQCFPVCKRGNICGGQKKVSEKVQKHILLLERKKCFPKRWPWPWRRIKHQHFGGHRLRPSSSEQHYMKNWTQPWVKTLKHEPMVNTWQLHMSSSWMKFDIRQFKN